MKSNTYSIIAVMALSLAVFTFSSCKKEGCMDQTASNYDADAKKDDGSCEYPEPAIEFSITDPAVGATFELGDTVHINAMITTETEVHGYEVYLRNKSNSDEVVYSMEEDVHESPIHIHGSWVNNVSSHADMELEVKLIIDHDGDSESEYVSFHCHPM